jgi:hypothetical protein
LPRSEILNAKEEPTVCSSCSIFFFAFFSAASRHS